MSIRLTVMASIATILLYAPAVSAFEIDDESTVSKNWGRSFQSQKEAQIANPEAGEVTGPVEGLEGRAAQKAMDAYYESFSQENSRRGYTLGNIGVIAGGSN